MEQQNFEHKSVLVNEVLDGLALQEGRNYIDATLGVGGHTTEILKTQPTCKVFGIDLDASSLEQATEQLKNQFGDKFTPMWGNYSHIYRLAKKNNTGPIHGVLADFGLSQFQIFNSDGFSFTHDTHLDMRISTGHTKVTASMMVNRMTERELSDLFFDLGQERYAKRIARAIVEERKKNKITRTVQLAELVSKAVPRAPYKHGRKPIHPATKVFQALRIAINDEFKHIKLFLHSSFEMLAPGGRLACISFHSLEDRLVKQFFIEQAHAGRGTIINKKPIAPSEEELETNPSSRSAKLRIIEKLAS